VNQITVRRTNGQNIVSFTGSTVPRSAYETIFVDAGTESITVAESDLTLDQALNRRSSCRVTLPTWRRFGLGVRCNLGVRWDGQFNVGRNFTNAAEGLELRVGAEIQMSGGCKYLHIYLASFFFLKSHIVLSLVVDASLDLHTREGGEVGFSVDPLAFRFKFSLEGQAALRNPGNGKAFTGLDVVFPTPLGTSLRVLGQEITLGVTIEFKMAPSLRGSLTYEMGVTFPGVNARARRSGLSFKRVGPDTSFTQNLQASVALEQRTDIAIKCGIRTRVLGSRLRSELVLQTGVSPFFVLIEIFLKQYDLGTARGWLCFQLSRK
jgi:hypothetical protein